MSSGRSAAIAAAIAAVVGAAAAASGSGSEVQGTPEFLQPGRCYRIAFTIEGPPNYKVIERLADGWVRAEVDAGPAGAQRPSLWMNTAQIISAAETRCSQ